MKRWFALLLSMVMLLALFTACGETTVEPTQVPTTKEPTTQAPATASPTSQPEETPLPREWVLPLTEEDVTLSWWFSENPSSTAYMPDGIASNTAFQHLQDITGITLEFTSVLATKATEAFNIMVNSGDMCDIFSNPLTRYSYGADAAIQEEILMDISELLKKYAPNISYYMDTYDEYDKIMHTDNGGVAVIYTVFENNSGEGFGPAVRQDWLEDLNLESPNTYEDYYNVLTAFKTEKGAEGAFYLPSSNIPNYNFLVGGYGIAGYMKNSTLPYFVEDGIVKFGYAEEGFREYLTMINKWWEEGLIYKDYMTNTDWAAPFEDVGNGEVGIWYCQQAKIDYYEDYAIEDSFAVAPIQDAVKKDGDISHHGIGGLKCGSGSNNHLGLSATCKHPELAVKLVDYIFSEEGTILANYGLEGQAWNYDSNGEIRLTELILNNEEGMTPSLALYKYAFSGIPFVSNGKRLKDTYTDISAKAMDVWASNRDTEYLFPPYVSMTAAESTEHTQIMADISTYCSENIAKFVVGDLPLSEFDAFVDTMYEQGLQDCIDLKQAAYDRAMKR